MTRLQYPVTTYKVLQSLALLHTPMTPPADGPRACKLPELAGDLCRCLNEVLQVVE